MIVHLCVEKQTDGLHKAFVPSMQWAWVMDENPQTAVRTLKLLFLSRLIDEYANSNAPVPSTITFTITNRPEAKIKETPVEEEKSEAIAA